MKRFKTNNMSIVNECRELFGVDLPSCSIASKTSRFLSKLKEFEQFSVECVFLTMASVAYPSFRFSSSCVYIVFFYHLW